MHWDGSTHGGHDVSLGVAIRADSGLGAYLKPEARTHKRGKPSFFFENFVSGSGGGGSTGRVFGAGETSENKNIPRVFSHLPTIMTRKTQNSKQKR